MLIANTVVSRFLLRTLLVLLFLGGSSNATEPEQAARLSEVQAKNTVRNISVALNQVYLYASKANYVAEELVSWSYTDVYNNGISYDQFLSEIRTKLVRATADTNIDLATVEPSFRYNKTGDAIFKNTDGTVEIKRLEKGIGYLKISGNAVTSDIKASILRGLADLKEQRALILDLRLAEKTDLEFVRQLISHFVFVKRELGRLITLEQSTILRATATDGFDVFKSNFPLYIVNSSFVTAEWEFLSYSLQSLNKATIFGEETMGIDHLTKPVIVSENLVLHLPYARLTHQNEQDSWGEMGVIPDYFITADKALEKAFHFAISIQNKSIP